ncbi:MAG TPA: hypothetical protein VGB85_20220, partial [Nannocystis sp.]
AQEPAAPEPASDPVEVADPFAASPSTVPAGAVRGGPPGVVPPARPPAPTAPASGPAAQVWETERPDTPAPGQLRRGLRVRSNYLHLAPGIIAADLRVADRYHAWGVGFGRYFAGDSRFAASIGGFFEHAWLFREAPNVSPPLGATHLLRFGPEARLGASGERVFGYVLARIGIDVAIDRRGMTFSDRRRDVALMHTSVGVGLQVAPGPWHRLILGAEPAVDLVFPAPLFLMRVRVFLGLRF